MYTTPIEHEAEYREAMVRIDTLWLSPDGSPESDELIALAERVEAYEKVHYPIPEFDPTEAAKFRREQLASA